MPVVGDKNWKPTAAAKGVRIVNPGGPNDHSGVTIKVIKRMKLLELDSAVLGGLSEAHLKWLDKIKNKRIQGLRRERVTTREV